MIAGRCRRAGSAVRLGNLGALVIMLPMPNWAFGADQTGYRQSGPARVAGLAAVMARVGFHSALVVVVAGASQRCDEAKDSQSAVPASSACPQAESMTTRPGPQTRSQILLDRHRTRRTCWPGTYGNSRCNDRSTVSSQYSRDPGDTRTLSPSARSRVKASPDAWSSTRPWRPAAVKFSR
jgi:hypothetical protein